MKLLKLFKRKHKKKQKYLSPNVYLTQPYRFPTEQIDIVDKYIKRKQKEIHENKAINVTSELTCFLNLDKFSASAQHQYPKEAFHKSQSDAY